MAEVTLSEYGDEAKELIRADSYDQAIAICRHILKHYPKYVKAYRLLGEACLEKGDYVEAANLFKRVLGADMEDMVVRVGLGIIFDEQGALDEAIWQLERAFELSPGNAEIRTELQRLYADRDGTTPPKLKLTPAALGRLYLREELYQRAIDEFRETLKEDPDRPDVQVALAQALWWGDQRQEAAEVCEAILETYPHCLKANLILGEILLSSDREAEGEALLEIAQATDPENAVAHTLFRDASPLAPRMVTVPRLEPTQLAEELEEMTTLSPPVGPDARREPQAPPVRPQERLDEAMPDWLRRLREEEQESEAEEVPTAPESHEMPDWLRQLAEEREAEGTDAVEPKDKSAESIEGEMPTWLRDLRGDAEERREAKPAPEEEPTLVEDISRAPEEPQEPAPELATRAEEVDEIHESVEEPPHWVGELGEDAVLEEKGAPQADQDRAEVPDWLSSLRADITPEHVGPEEEAPAWLPDLGSELSEEEGPAGEEEVLPWSALPTEDEQMERPEPEAAEGERYISAQLAEAEAEISQETMDRLRETMPDESASIEEIMAWMERSKALLEEEGIPQPSLEQEMEPPGAGAEGPGKLGAEEELPPWMADWRPTVEAPEEAVDADRADEPLEEVALPTPEEEIPAWLRQLRPEVAVSEGLAPEEGEEIPEEEVAWSQEEDSTITAEQPETVVSEAPAPTPADQEMPSWLLELREEAMQEKPPGYWVEEVSDGIAEAPPQEEEMPSWLEELKEEATEEEAALASGEAEGAEETLGPPAEEEMPSWLRELRAEEGRDRPAPPEEEVKPPGRVEPVPHPIEAELPAWLKELKEEMAREGEVTPPEEIQISAEEEPVRQVEEEEVPAWLGELGAEADLEQALGPSEAETAAEEPPLRPLEEDIPSWLHELRARAAEGETGLLMEKAEAAAEEVPLSPLEEEELPSWLRELRARAEGEEISVAYEEAGLPVQGLPAEEPPAEEEAEPLVGERVAPAISEEEEEEAAAPSAEAEAAEERPAPGWGIDEYLDYLKAKPRDHDARLALARAYSQAGDLDQAAEQYGTVLSYGSMVQEIVKDLEAAADSAPDHLTTQELLADAYMRSGQLQKALDKYRWLRVMITR